MLHTIQREERLIYSAICRHRGIRARDIEKVTGIDKHTVNRCLYGAPFLKELCWQDKDYCWHGLIRQDRPHSGLGDFCGYYDALEDFLLLPEEEWFEKLLSGCTDIGRNLNDTRGLFHSFRDCRETMVQLFADLDGVCRPDWEIAFELRIRRAKYIRIYSDVLVITENRVFALEFKMKDSIEPEEVIQAAKYVPYLEMVFGPGYDVIPALVLTRARDLYTHVPIGKTEGILPVCSGDMLFNLFDEYMEFLQR